jgi:UDP-N-acetylmuramate: L-alanyl-gamma-D-glutamyl-meso-diaminopimelate ligase
MKKWLHIIGISGKTTANIARAFQSYGWFVTGSDHQFLPPASKIIEENKIPVVDSYHFSHLTKSFWETELGKELDVNENPDDVIIVESVTAKNKEYLYAKHQGLKVRGYSAFFEENVVKENSLVVAGTAGKTTTTALLVHIFNQFGIDPTYMVGADVESLDSSLKVNNSDWSILEGDEYHNPDFSKGAKFLYYNPKYLIITNIGYEHEDVFPTKEDYVREFHKLVQNVPRDGVIVSHSEDTATREILSDSLCNNVVYVTYSDDPQNIKEGEWNVIGNSQSFEIYTPRGELLFKGTTKLIGKNNLLDIGFAVAMTFSISEIGAQDKIDHIRTSISSFSGVKKRLEVTYKDDDRIVIEDFGVTPERAKNSLETLKSEFPEYSITAVYEPNSASRYNDQDAFKSAYNEVFKNADNIIIPTLSGFNEGLASQEEFVHWLRDIGYNVENIPTEDIVAKLSESIKGKKSLVVFFSTYRLDSESKSLVNKIKGEVIN